MFDTSVIWARVLRILRDNDESILHSACSNIDVEFTNDEIILTTASETVVQVLQRYHGKLNEYAGGQYIKINLGGRTKNRREVVEKLREIFGEKLKVQGGQAK